MITFEQLCEAVYEDLNGQIVAVRSDDTGHRVSFECDDWNDYKNRRHFELLFEGVVEATTKPFWIRSAEYRRRASVALAAQ